MEAQKLRNRLKKILSAFGVSVNKRRSFFEKINKYSIGLAISENNFWDLIGKLRKIAPDISNQNESAKDVFNDYWELKQRALQAFQCNLLLKALDNLSSNKLTVVDIGDSAGTHMLYLKELTKGVLDIDTISVNLDPRAIEKIKSRGQEAILSRAEELDMRERKVDLFTSFEMVEHLHNPAIFFKNLTARSSCKWMVITVPYLRQSRTGLHHIRYNLDKKVCAEDTHIFELSPQDWTRLILHSGWKVVFSRIYYQYPRRWPLLSHLSALYWKYTDFEGFWGAILERDCRVSDLYQDWQA